MHTNLACIKNLKKLILGQIGLCKQYRPRSDSAENKGMKLILGNRNHENLENTFRTIRPVRPVNTQISLGISLRCSYELLWHLGFSRSPSEYMRFLIKASIAFFRRCLSQVFLYFSRVFQYYCKLCDRSIWLRFHPEP